MIKSRKTLVFSSMCVLILCLAGSSVHAQSPAVEFCLDGQFDLGARSQGTNPEAGESYPARFCVITENDSNRVHFFAEGKSNPDMDGDWAVSYLADDRVRIVNRTSPPDIEFSGADAANEALGVRRLDPRRLVAELGANPDWQGPQDNSGARQVNYPGSQFVTSIKLVGGRLERLQTMADLPLRGRVPVVWQWHWRTPESPEVKVFIDGIPLFDAKGAFRPVPADEASAIWKTSGQVDPIQVPGDRWPSRVNMSVEEIASGVHMVRGVRTGFSHLVVETEQGLVIADAPAGWLEIHQVPPADLVPGMGISGLSENFIRFLRQSFPDQPIRAVAITHAHDDHAGGARAFAAEGGQVYAPGPVAGFLQKALNDPDMPRDRLSGNSKALEVIPVVSRHLLPDTHNPVELVPIPDSPHVSAALGVWVPGAKVFYQSDLHVPDSDEPQPRADRFETECWFAQWAVHNLPPETRVFNSHSNPATPVFRLAEYLHTDTCKKKSG